MKRRHLYPALASTASIMLAGALFADFEEDANWEWLENSAGAVEIEEVRESESRRLKRLDDDGDGSVSRDEFAARSPFGHPGKRLRIAGIGAASADDAAELAKRIVEVIESQRWGRRISMAPPSKRRIVIGKLDGESVEEIELDAVVAMEGAIAVDEIDLDFGLPWSGIPSGVIPWQHIDTDEWFDIADANEDGVLDREEVSGARQRLRDHRIQQRFDMLDANKDDQLNDEDIDARLEKLRALDEDGDGSVSPRELSEVLRLLGNNRMFDQTRAIRLRREHGPR